MATVSPPEPWAYALQLPHAPCAPRIARATLRAVLWSHGMGQLIYAAELLVSEMVTNAYRHAEGPAALRLREVGADRLRVSVWDTNPYIPAPFDRPSGPMRALPSASVPYEDESGRGLCIVRSLADTWGSFPLGDDLFGRGGKLLWVEVGKGPALVMAA
ncbi:ATP-binding protein [Streptomyces sp. NPDC051561]|uniref:ATP-binding protein n=1 Tax=Streptomyces sp. NPDC051561 TaxID=3365658 RepID=UPI0037B453E6